MDKVKTPVSLREINLIQFFNQLEVLTWPNYDNPSFFLFWASKLVSIRGFLVLRKTKTNHFFLKSLFKRKHSIFFARVNSPSLNSLSMSGVEKVAKSILFKRTNIGINIIRCV